MGARNDVRALPESYQRLHAELAGVLGAERVVCDPLRTLAYGTDASFYRLIPKVVVKVATTAELSAVLKSAGRLGLPVTYRTAGTSLSGQAITDSILVLLAGAWRGARVMDGGERIALEPGVIGAEANAMLAPYGRKIGPDPASINAAMIGGIAANNAAGMCCGTAQNSYRTVEAMKLVLSDGTPVDTADPESRRRLAAQRPELLAELAAIRDEIRSDAALETRIREKYRIKNTTGYSINAFVDYQDPIDILAHLMIGSEGTQRTITPPRRVEGADRCVVYFPSCVTRTMGPSRTAPDQRGVSEAMLSLLAKAGYDVVFPVGLDALCCGMAFESKGFPETADQKSAELAAALLEASGNGAMPVLCDTSPCLHRMKKKLDPALDLYEPVEFIHTFLMSRLRLERKAETVVLHLPCSTQKMGLAEKMKAVAHACAEKVIVPAAIQCCGFAGDKGFSVPELNASALSRLRAQLPGDCRAGYSNSRTCEIGLTEQGGIPYSSIVHLVDRCSTSARPAPSNPVI